MSGSTWFPASEQPAPAPPFAEAAKCSPSMSENREGQSGLRTERVTLELTLDARRQHHLPAWNDILRDAWALWPTESVRVVEERVGSVDERAYADRMGCDEERDFAYRILAERDAAIRERDRIRENAKAEHNIAKAALDERDTAIRERDSWRILAEKSDARVDSLTDRVAELELQLESVACRAATAETALESAPAASEWRMLKVGEEVEAGDEMTDDMFMPWRDAGPCVGQEAPRGPIAFRRRVTAPSASGAVGTEPVPVAWGVMVDGKIDRTSFAAALFLDKATAESWCRVDSLQGNATVVPLLAAPQPAPGWLTAGERAAVVRAASELGEEFSIGPSNNEAAAVLRNILARSSPPEVVLPVSWTETNHINRVMSAEAVIAALAAAGVPWKEVG